MVPPPGTHFTAESTEAMPIKCLAQGHNILMPGLEPSTPVSRNRHSNHMTNTVHFFIIDVKLMFADIDSALAWR